MRNKDDMIANLCNSILAVSNDKNLYNYCKRKIDANYNYLKNIKDNLVTADRYGEKLEINVDENNKTVDFYSTEWGKTDITKIFYQRDEEGYTFVYKNNDVAIIDGLISTECKSLFDKEGSLIYVSKEEKRNVDFTMKKERRRKNKIQISEIYVIGNDSAIKRISVNGKVRFYLIESIPSLSLNDGDVFGKINNRPVIEIDEESFETIKNNSYNQKSNQKILKLG